MSVDLKTMDDARHETLSAEAQVLDVTTASFMAEVVEASQTQLVVVDFWAAWCGPCKQLTPLLAAAIEGINQQHTPPVRFAKVNVDDNQALAAQLRVQSLPTVFIFANGQPVDGFVGVKSQSEITALIQRCLEKMAGAGTPKAMLDMAAEALAGGDIATALSSYQSVLGQDANNVVAAAGMLRCLLLGGDLTTARQVLSNMPASLTDHKAVSAIVRGMDFTENALKEAEHLNSLLADSTKPQAKAETFHALARAQYGAGQVGEAIATLLNRIEINKTDSVARQHLLDIFAIGGNTSPEIAEGRRRLSALLFA